MKYLIKPGKDADRRSDPRKKTDRSIPVEVQDLPAEKGGDERPRANNVQAEKTVAYEKLRQTPRKRAPNAIRANVLVNGFSNGVVEDVSRGGLRISSVIRLQPYKEIGIYFTLPGQNKGITLICQVRWFEEYRDGASHWAGLKILKTSDDQSFCAFVDTLPPIEAARN